MGISDKMQTVMNKLNNIQTKTQMEKINHEMKHTNSRQ